MEWPTGPTGALRLDVQAVPLLDAAGGLLGQINLFLNSILTSMRGGVAVVDPDLRLQIWNERAEDLWGLRAVEVLGTHLLNLDIGLLVDQLRRPLRSCLSGESMQAETVLEATNRRGRAIQCTVTCMPLIAATGEIRGAIMLMKESEGAARD